MELWIEPAVSDGTIGCLTGPGFPVAATEREGGVWRGVRCGQKIKAPAAVLFDNGMVFDFVLNASGRHPWRSLVGKPTIRVQAESVAQ